MRVTLTGTYSSWNKGDAAMELATIAALQAAVPGLEVIVSSPFAAHDRPTYEPTRVVQCNRRGALGFLQVGLALLIRVLGQKSWLVRTDELRAMADSDVVVDLSGDMLTEDYGVLVAISHYLPLLTALALGVPYVVCAQSVGPFRWTSPLAHLLLRRAAAVTVRESISADRLRPVRPDLELTADMAYLLSPTPERVPHDLAIPDGPLIGLSVSSLVANRHEPDGAASFDDAVVEALTAVLEEHPDHSLVVVAHVTGPSDEKDDRVPARRIAARLGDRATVVEADLHPTAIKAVIARCDVFVGARMHANIAALTTGVPVVAIGYSHKTAGIMKEFEQSDVVLRSEDLRADVLAAAATRLLAERQERHETLVRRKAVLVRQAQRNITIITDLLPRTRA